MPQVGVEQLARSCPTCSFSHLGETSSSQKRPPVGTGDCRTWARWRAAMDCCCTSRSLSGRQTSCCTSIRERRVSHSALPASLCRPAVGAPRERLRGPAWSQPASWHAMCGVHPLCAAADDPPSLVCTFRVPTWSTARLEEGDSPSWRASHANAPIRHPPAPATAATAYSAHFRRCSCSLAAPIWAWRSGIGSFSTERPSICSSLS